MDQFKLDDHPKESNFSVFCSGISYLFCAILLLLIFPLTTHADEEYELKEQLCALSAIAVGNRAYVSSSTGDEILDRQLSLEANRLAKIFGIRPGLKIVNAPKTMANNGLATIGTLVKGTQGTIFLGRELIFNTLIKENRRGWGGLIVTGFMAHEFAHIYQFFSDFNQRLIQGRSTAEAIELHADFLAGYYLGLKRRDGHTMDIGAFTDGIYLLGDSSFQSQSHHGTRAKRRRAVREGYRTGIKEGQRPISTIAEIGIQKVQEIMNSSI